MSGLNVTHIAIVACVTTFYGYIKQPHVIPQQGSTLKYSNFGFSSCKKWQFK